jgi:hypothetical protein
MQHFGRFRSEADMDRQAKLGGLVENDLIITSRRRLRGGGNESAGWFMMRSSALLLGRV